MISNYFKMAFRNLMRNRPHFFVNMTGLVIGFSTFLLILLVLTFEQSYDTFHVNKDHIYRLVRQGKNEAAKSYSAGIPFPMAGAISAEYPQVAATAQIYAEKDMQVIVPAGSNGVNKKFLEPKGVFLAEPQFFRMFSFPMAVGSAADAIREPATALLTKEYATKYFGDWRVAQGKIIRVRNKDITVTGVLENPPANTDFPLSVVISHATLAGLDIEQNNWTGISDNNYCFIQMKPGYTQQQLEAQLPGFISKHIPANYAGYDLKLQPLAEMHTDKHSGNFNNRTFSKDLIAALRMIGTFLLIIAGINFINLSTANAINRAREVGVRKVLGSSRGQLLFQFFGEAGVTCLLAMIVAMAAALVVFPAVNRLLEVNMSWHILLTVHTLLSVLGVLLIVTVLAGFYPALILSGFNPINALKSVVQPERGKGMSLRRSLVVLQFVIAQVLIIGTLVVISQMRYSNNADMGFNRDAIITARFPHDSIALSKIEVARNLLLQRERGISGISFSAFAPTGVAGWATDMRLSTNHTDKIDLIVNMKPADTGYFSVYNFQLLAGRVYFPSDTMNEFVVNETLLKKAGLGAPGEAIGKRIYVNGQLCPIVGVVKDFHSKSFREGIDNIVMTNARSSYGAVNVKLSPARAKEVIAAMESVWNELFPDYVFEYSFIDQTIADYYKQEQQLSRLFSIFAGIAVFISCLGLYGLVSFMLVRRKKEIGIRKVLGAPVSNIIFLLSSEFLLPILLAFVIAAPVAWYFMNDWLQQYSFRINLGANFFIITFLLSILIAWFTVGASTIRAAIASPTKNLRTE